MEGLISAYRLTSKTGREIAAIKEMPKAWSNPTFLPNLFSNPGPLFLYDKLYLDQRSYEDFYDDLPNALRKVVKTYVESQELNIFELINAESLLSEKKGDVFEVQKGFEELYEDSQFVEAVSAIQSCWGNYARPTPLKFEAMNIPVIELLREKWSSELQKDLTILDEIERALLYRTSWQKKFSRTIVPEISRLVIDLMPKFFAIIPQEDNWNIDTIRRIRENEHLTEYRKKVERIAKEAGKKFEKYLTKTELPKRWDPNYSLDILDKLGKFMESIQSDIFDELANGHAELENRLTVNRWSILGGVTACTGAVVSPVNPPFGAALGVAGGVLVLTEQTINYFKKRRCGWVEFLEFVSREMKRDSLVNATKKGRSLTIIDKLRRTISH